MTAGPPACAVQGYQMEPIFVDAEVWLLLDSLAEVFLSLSTKIDAGTLKC